MKLYEFEAKEIFKQAGIAIPEGKVVSTAVDAVTVFKHLKTPVMLKSQVLVGGRGKAGGIQFANDSREAVTKANQLLNLKINNFPVYQILVEKQLDIAEEIFCGITVDRTIKRYVGMISRSGGVDIEEVAKTDPLKIAKSSIDPILGLREFQARNLAKKAGFIGNSILVIASIMSKLWWIVKQYDAELVEINPLIHTKDNKFIAADARLNIDDNSLFRQERASQLLLERKKMLNPREFRAKQEGMNYVELDGEIGIIGNGAGLVMATMDTVQLYGGKPANFLDVGGGASAIVMEKSLDLVLSHPSVKVVLINILGGITRCDDMATGILAARKVKKYRIPIVIRMIGTREQQGREMLNKAGIAVFNSMDKAAEEAVRILNTGSR